MDVNTILDFLSKLGEQVSVAGQQVFEVYVKQSYANGVTDLIVAGIFILASIALVVLSIVLYKREFKNDNDDEPICFGFGMLFDFVAIILFLIATKYLVDGVKEILNPQYYALQDLINVVKTTVSK